jgi:hypothetical protein
MKTFLRLSSLALALCAAAAACNPHVITGSGPGGSGPGGSGPGGSGSGGSCGIQTFTCAAAGTCPDGTPQTIHVVCEGSTWACVEDPCPIGCGEYDYQYCASGIVETQCCPAGAPCPAPEPYCDLGNGYCNDGPCLSDGGTCGDSISASSFDQFCVADTDCAAVYQGDLCGGCLCPNAAINQNVLTVYNEDIAAAEPDPPSCFCPTSGAPQCISGTCALVGGV